jgi:hypothetical protein
MSRSIARHRHGTRAHPGGGPPPGGQEVSSLLHGSEFVSAEFPGSRHAARRSVRPASGARRSPAPSRPGPRPDQLPLGPAAEAARKASGDSLSPDSSTTTGYAAAQTCACPRAARGRVRRGRRGHFCRRTRSQAGATWIPAIGPGSAVQSRNAPAASSNGMTRITTALARKPPSSPGRSPPESRPRQRCVSPERGAPLSRTTRRRRKRALRRDRRRPPGRPMPPPHRPPRRAREASPRPAHPPVSPRSRSWGEAARRAPPRVAPAPACGHRRRRPPRSRPGALPRPPHPPLPPTTGHHDPVGG